MIGDISRRIGSGSRTVSHYRILERTVSHYRILEKLGEGGFGEVFKAEDLRLKRLVAMKFLSGAHSENETSRKAFLDEARAIALLDHPNICTVFEIDETPEKETFIVMQFLGGGTVKDLLSRGPLAVSDALDIGLQVAQGLSAAHAARLIHRDIKPGNIMLSGDKTAKIVDFGLALIQKPTSADLTETGVQAAGTLAYMSPEQLRGQRVDTRTDLWALGVVLHQMISGKYPFQSESALTVMYSILNDTPERLKDLRPDVPDRLDWIVQKALSRSIDDRYQRADEMAADVAAIRQGRTSVAIIATPPPEPPPSIAVLPFADMSAEQDQGFFGEGIAEEIINSFSQVDGIQVASRGSSFQFPRTCDVREVGEKLKVKMVLEGSVRRSGSRLRITAHLTNTQNGYQVWSKKFDRTGEDIFDIQDEIALAISRELKLQLTGETVGVRRYTENTGAYNLYLKGRYFWNHRVPDAIRKATAHYKEALALDPGYALAYCGLADCYLVPAYYGNASPGQVIPLARAAVQGALDRDPQLPEAHTSLGMIAAVHDYDWATSEKHFQRALAESPNNPAALMWYALFCLVPMGRFNDAVLTAKRAQEVDPLTPAVSTVFGACLYYQGQHGHAVRELERTVEMDPRAVIANYFLGRAYWEVGEPARAIASIERAVGIYRLGLMEGYLAGYYHRNGREREAMDIVAALRAPGERYVPAASLAPYYMATGEFGPALDLLEKGFEERSFYLIWVHADPAFAPLVAEPRFQDLLARTGTSVPLRAQRQAAP